LFDTITETIRCVSVFWDCLLCQL